MTDYPEQLTKIVPSDQLDMLSQAYKIEKLKNPSKKVSITKLFTKYRVGRRKQDKLTAVLGGIDRMHDFLARIVDPETENMTRLLNETIEAQRNDLPSMAPKDRNDLLKLLLEFSKIDEKSPHTEINFNMDQFLKNREFIDVTE